MPRHYIES